MLLIDISHLLTPQTLTAFFQVIFIDRRHYRRGLPMPYFWYLRNIDGQLTDSA
jgi:hypothetical protein